MSRRRSAQSAARTAKAASAEKSEFLRAPEVARFLGVSRSLVLRLFRRQTLPAFQFGRVWLVRREDFKKYIAKLQSKCTAAQLEAPSVQMCDGASLDA